MPKPVHTTPDQQLKAQQVAQTKWGEDHGHFPKGTAAKVAKTPRMPLGKAIIASLVANRKPAPVFNRTTLPYPSAIKAKAATTGTMPLALADKLIKLETARAKKNDWNSEFSRLEKEVKADFEHVGKDKYTCDLLVKDGQDEDRKVTVTLSKQTGGTVQVETLDKAALRRLVTPVIYDKCTVIQKGLIKEHAGEAVLAKITTVTNESLEGTVVTIESKKDKTIS